MKKIFTSIAYFGFCWLVLACGPSKRSEIQDQDTDEAMISLDTSFRKVAAGTLFYIKDFPSKFVSPRTIEVWIPNHQPEGQSYSVVYMQDGQNLFDANTTWNQQEWGVDETANALIKGMKTKPFMVVAIHSIDSLRTREYYPQKTMNYLAVPDKSRLKNESILQQRPIEESALLGDAYLSFLVKELKPYIDQQFPTKTDRAHTFIAGSSMGGLISWYAVSEYPNVFGGAACLSTHWPGVMPMQNNPAPESMFAYIKEAPLSPTSHLFYMDYGTATLDAHYQAYQTEVSTVFTKKGFSDSGFVNKKFEGHAHDEKAWRKRLPEALTFLLRTNE